MIALQKTYAYGGLDAWVLCAVARPSQNPGFQGRIGSLCDGCSYFWFVCCLLWLVQRIDSRWSAFWSPALIAIAKTIWCAPPV
jgi:prenyltransferase beta subunit